MTEIRFISREPGEIGLSITGHSGFAEIGKDLVCAGITTLVMALIDAVQEEPGYDANVKYEEGSIEVTCLPDEAHRDQCFEDFRVILCGLDRLAGSFPDNVTFRRSNNDGN